MILVLTIWAGEFVLQFFGIEISSLRVAGGLMIGSIALSMLHSKQNAIHNTKQDGATSTQVQDIAVVPLAMPIIAGPGAMVTVIVNTHQHTGTEANVALSVVCIVLSAAICMGFLAAGPVTRVLGGNGLEIVTKLMGMVLLAVAASMIAAGAAGLLPGLAG